MTEPAFHGLIQHSFALRLAKEHRPFGGLGNSRTIQERFALPANDGVAFDVRGVCDPSVQGDLGCPGGREAPIAGHSPLVQSGQTSVQAKRISFSWANGGTSDPALPPAFGWAGEGGGCVDHRQDGPTFVFADVNPATQKAESNDFLVERSGGEAGAGAISRSLLEVLAHKRSRLLGLALAHRIVSVMLPHAILTPVDGRNPSARHAGSWFAQPLVSFVRGGRKGTEFRSSYSLTLMLVPITAPGYEQRKMSVSEVDRMVNAGWGLAAVPTRESPLRFQLDGPLIDYLPRLVAPHDLAGLLGVTGFGAPAGVGSHSEAPTLRQGTELLAFTLGLRLARAPVGETGQQTICGIGDDVVTSLGSARVSSVLVRGDFKSDDIRQGKEKPLDGHHHLMARISRETRPPVKRTQYRTYRLDQAFVDDETYVVGVVPTKRCLVVSCAAEAQHGWYQSGLMQAGSLTHMTVGAATAIGTLRAIDRDLERLTDADPGEIAEIDDEIATDLRELYDLDITSEDYRSLYSLLCERFAITRDYKALQDKMGTLYRATSTRHELRTRKQLRRLNVVIAVLAVLTVVVGVIAILK